MTQMPNIATHLSCPCWSQYTAVYCDTQPQPSSHLSCNTIIVLQYNPQQPPLAIQTQPLHTQVTIQSMYCNIMAQQLTSLLQYNSSHSTSLVNLQYTLYCNTKTPSLAIQLGSSPNQFCTNFFFVFHYIFFLLFPAIGKH